MTREWWLYVALIVSTLLLLEGLWSLVLGKSLFRSLIRWSPDDAYDAPATESVAIGSPSVEAGFTAWLPYQEPLRADDERRPREAE